MARKQPGSTQWEPMATAPRDGSPVLARLRATEQGPAEVDTVRWSTSARSREEGWVANDSDPEARVVYAENELSAWQPLPGQMPRLRAERQRKPQPIPTPEEGDGSGV